MLDMEQRKEIRDNVEVVAVKYSGMFKKHAEELEAAGTYNHTELTETAHALYEFVILLERIDRMVDNPGFEPCPHPA